jgi:hypothetical protein
MVDMIAMKNLQAIHFGHFMNAKQSIHPSALKLSLQLVPAEEKACVNTMKMLFVIRIEGNP